MDKIVTMFPYLEYRKIRRQFEDALPKKIAYDIQLEDFQRFLSIHLAAEEEGVKKTISLAEMKAALMGYEVVFSKYTHRDEPFATPSELKVGLSKVGKLKTAVHAIINKSSRESAMFYEKNSS